MEGGAEWSATGVEYRAVVTHEGSIPSLSASRTSYGIAAVSSFGRDALRDRCSGHVCRVSLEPPGTNESPVQVHQSACKAGVVDKVGSIPTALTSPSSSADRTSGSEPEGAWFESTGGHCLAVQRIKALEGSNQSYRQVQAGLE